ncbi:MAG TPA: single-stranded DNA-binding protein [Candidatus Paceibacterota bacterium]|nr:single-stranded DNA-binding protein [Candidatus Paceibacterota bacterium]
MYLNKVFILGNLTRDPEKRSLPSGAAVASFSLATTRVYKDKNGVKQEDTQYHNIVAFGPQAETIAQYMKKGSSILVEGRLQTRSWDAPDGTKKYRTEIIVDAFQFGPKRDSTSSGAGSYQASAGGEGGASRSSQPAPTVPELETIQYPTEEINVDDIPF